METKEYLLIYNFKSGKGKIRKDITKIKAFFELNKQRLELFESKEKKDILKLINSHYSKYTNWIVAGGDGTVSSVVNVVMQINGNRPVISVLPYGSANDIAYILGMKKKLSFNLKTILQEKPILMDLNKVNDKKYFVYTIAAGIFTDISYTTNRKNLNRFGRLAYYFEGLKKIQDDESILLNFKVLKREFSEKYNLFLGLASNRVGGFTLYRKKNSKLNDSLIDIHLFEKKNKFSIFRIFLFLLRMGKKVKSDNIIQTKYIDIKAKKDIKWNADGEYLCSGSVFIEVIPKCLNVIASQKSKKFYF